MKIKKINLWQNRRFAWENKQKNIFNILKNACKIGEIFMLENGVMLTQKVAFLVQKQEKQ